MISHIPDSVVDGGSHACLVFVAFGEEGKQIATIGGVRIEAADPVVITFLIVIAAERMGVEQFHIPCISHGIGGPVVNFVVNALLTIGE